MSAGRILLLVAIATALAGCGEADDPGGPTFRATVADAPPAEPAGDPLDGGFPALETPVKGGVMRVALAHDLDCWTGMSGEPSAASVFAFAARGLYGRPATVAEPAASLLQPDLAVDLPTVEEDGLAIVVRLRDGLRFPGGQPVTAQDVKATFELMLDPRAQCATVGPLASGYYDGIVGAPERAAAIAAGEEAPGLDGIEIRDAQTVAFRLRAPDPAFPEALALPWAFIRPAGTAPDPAAGPPAFVGPYRLVAAARGDAPVAEREPGWPGNVEAGVPESPWENNVDSLEVEVDAAPALQRERIARGELDASLDGSAAAGVPVRRLVDDPAFAGRLYSSPNVAVTYAVLRADRAPFGALDARRAVNLAVDRRAVVRALGGTLGGRAWSQILPSTLLAGQPSDLYARDRRAARVLVAETGLARRPVVIAHAADAPWADVARAVADGLRAVGVRARLRAVDPVAFPALLADPATAWDIALTGWQLPYPDAAALYVPLLRCGAGGNAGLWCDPGFDAIVADVGTLALGPERTSQFGVLATDTGETEAPWLVLAEPRRVDLVSARVGNFRWGSRIGIDLAVCFVRP